MFIFYILIATATKLSFGFKPTRFARTPAAHDYYMNLANLTASKKVKRRNLQKSRSITCTFI